jgi:hypothetical protein
MAIQCRASIVQHKHSEYSQLTCHRNKCAAIDGNELWTYYEGGCVVADSVYITAEVTAH